MMCSPLVVGSPENYIQIVKVAVRSQWPRSIGLAISRWGTLRGDLNRCQLDNARYRPHSESNEIIRHLRLMFCQLKHAKRFALFQLGLGT